MPTKEPTINDALAQLLRETRHAWRSPKVIYSENTGLIKESQAQLDILVLEPFVSPVVIETEVFPAQTVEAEAISRLGLSVKVGGAKILSSVALRIPNRLRNAQGIVLKEQLAAAEDLEIALYTGIDPKNCFRWPRSGWIRGGIRQLTVLVQAATIPPELIEKAADQLEAGVNEAADQLDFISGTYPPAIKQICEELHLEDCLQTRRIATTILANAFIFQGSLARGPGELAKVQSIADLRDSNDGLSKGVVLEEWGKILKVNYWPIFHIAKCILKPIPAEVCATILERLAVTADRLLKNRLMRSHDLTGKVFQRLIADRKFLAAFYTTPASAALLVGLAIRPDQLPNSGSWNKAEDVANLRIADFACGTGTLLSTVYHRMGQLHELAGGDAELLHPRMMSAGLIGCDVLPAAAHLTASMLAGAHPTVKYDQSSILTVAYGKLPDGNVALGSLDLLDPQGKFEIFAITSKVVESAGESEKATWLALPHTMFDMVVMNPPFTRPTAHEGKSSNVPNPMFGAFGSSAEEQRLMAAATKRLTKGSAAHGNAGEASIFLVLADRKLKAGGMLAMVMPLSLMSGESWEDARLLLKKNYEDLILISIAGKRPNDLSFSADTGMGECLLIGRKSNGGSKRATFVILGERPAYPLLGESAAEQICQLIAGKIIRRLEDGPVGGTQLHFGDDVIGQILDAPLPTSGIWNLSRISDISLAQAAYQIINEGRIWLPAMNRDDAVNLPMTTVEAIGNIGPVHRDINGYTPTKEIRGPFDIAPITPNSAPTYPVLWAHDAPKERTIVFQADCEGLPRRGSDGSEKALLEGKVAAVWNTASHCHFNCDFQFNSQSTAMQFTRRKTIGGRAWPSIQLSSAKLEKALVLWANTSLGLLLRWWHSNKQQSGRGSIGVSALRSMPILDVSAFSSTQLAGAVKIFDDMCSSELLPVHQIDEDPIRAKLDNRFAREVLGLPESILAPGGPLELLRMKLSREPSIRGSK